MSSSSGFNASAASSLAAARGTLLSIVLRLLSFLLSQLTVRFVSAAALGKASIQLELLLSTTLFVGREGFRLALTKEVGDDDGDGVGGDGGRNGGDATEKEASSDDLSKMKVKEERMRRDRQRVINVSWLSVPTGAVLSLIALLIHLRKCDNDKIDSDGRDTRDEYALLDYRLAGILYCLASLVESLSEPLVIRCLQRMDLATKAKAEGAALVMKSASCFGCLYLTECGWFVTIITTIMGSEKGAAPEEVNFAVTAFGASQCVYALAFMTIMYRKGMSSVGGIHWPKRIESSSLNNPYRDRGTPANHATIKEAAMSGASIARNLDLPALHLVMVFALQGLFKHALTEADRIVLSALSDSYDQGVYALAASYGGLAARLLLQPVEENARLLFSRRGATLATAEKQNDDSDDNGKGDAKDGGEEKESKTKTFMNMFRDLEETYFFLIRVVVCIGLLFAAVGSNYTLVLLRVLAGNRWGTNAEAGAALSAFCVYTAFLALNGITEAFVYGVARSGSDVGRIGIVHASVGGIFALMAPGLVRQHGAVGLVAANCTAMALRSIYSLYYAHGYFARGHVAKARSTNAIIGTLFCIMPHAIVLVAFGTSFVITRMSKNHLYDAQIAAGKSWMVAGAQHVGVGVLCVLATGALSLWLEGDIQSSLVRLVKRKRD